MDTLLVRHPANERDITLEAIRMAAVADQSVTPKASSPPIG